MYFFSQNLPGGNPLYFTVYAVNSAGGTSTATCSLSTFDVTLPTGRITPYFKSTSHPHILRASAVVYDDSVILLQREGVGLGVGIWGDQIVPWHTVDVTAGQQLQTSGERNVCLLQMPNRKQTHSVIRNLIYLAPTTTCFNSHSLNSRFRLSKAYIWQTAKAFYAKAEQL